MKRWLSPDGNIQIVRKKDLAPPNFARWCGLIDIPGHDFALLGRRFSEPMIFSPNSRFLALTELTVSSQSRVTVLDFSSDKELIAYESPQRPKHMVCISSLNWSEDESLIIGIFKIPEGNITTVWRAA
jgi:hypothetical protein